MKHLKIILLAFPIFLFSNCSGQKCQEGLNLLPMYGEQKKCDFLARSDSDFIKSCDSYYHNRAEAAQHFVRRGWEYWYRNIMDTAMFRFNQAWLLDSTNAEVYWGFGNIVGAKGQFRESVRLFEMAIRLNPKNTGPYHGIAISYGNLYYQSKDQVDLKKAIDYLKVCIDIDPSDTLAYSQLTNSYSYFLNKDSAIKYLNITDKLSPKAVNPKVRELLRAK